MCEYMCAGMCRYVCVCEGTRLPYFFSIICISIIKRNLNHNRIRFKMFDNINVHLIMNVCENLWGIMQLNQLKRFFCQRFLISMSF